MASHIWQVHVYQLYLNIAVGVLTILEAYHRSDVFISAARLGLLAFAVSMRSLIYTGMNLFFNKDFLVG